MRKQEFLKMLKRNMRGLSKEEIDERLSFYSEMIDDRIEEGCSEEEAVEKVASSDDILGQNERRTRVMKAANGEKSGLTIALLIIGSPIWIALLCSAFAVLISFWAAVVSLWATFIALIASSLGCTVAAIPFAIIEGAAGGLACFGAGCVCAGLAVFAYYGCRVMTKGMWLVTKKSVIGIKNLFVKKEELI